jgi:hypothetical protein
MRIAVLLASFGGFKIPVAESAQLAQEYSLTYPLQLAHHFPHLPPDVAWIILGFSPSFRAGCWAFENVVDMYVGSTPRTRLGIVCKERTSIYGRRVLLLRTATTATSASRTTVTAISGSGSSAGATCSSTGRVLWRLLSDWVQSRRKSILYV